MTDLVQFLIGNELYLYFYNKNAYTYADIPVYKNICFCDTYNLCSAFRLWTYKYLFFLRNINHLDTRNFVFQKINRENKNKFRSWIWRVILIFSDTKSVSALHKTLAGKSIM